MDLVVKIGFLLGKVEWWDSDRRNTVEEGVVDHAPLPLNWEDLLKPL